MITLFRSPAFRPHSLLLLCLFVLLGTGLISPAPAPAADQTRVRAATPGESNRAAETDSAKRLAERTAIKAGATPIDILHDGTDSLGAKLAYQLKEIFNSGTLFSLSDKDEPKLQLIIVTAQEFPSRPGVGSIYCAVWTYSERPTALSNHLAQEVGIVTPENLSQLADKLASRTSGLAAKHAYIFNR